MRGLETRVSCFVICPYGAWLEPLDLEKEFPAWTQPCMPSPHHCFWGITRLWRSLPKYLLEINQTTLENKVEHIFLPCSIFPGHETSFCRHALSLVVAAIPICSEKFSTLHFAHPISFAKSFSDSCPAPVRVQGGLEKTDLVR